MDDDTYKAIVTLRRRGFKVAPAKNNRQLQF